MDDYYIKELKQEVLEVCEPLVRHYLANRNSEKNEFVSCITTERKSVIHRQWQAMNALVNQIKKELELKEK